MNANKKDAICPRNEWDFSKVPSSEMETCFRFEYAREIIDPHSYFSSRGIRLISEPRPGQGWEMEQLNTIGNLICNNPLEQSVGWLAKGVFLLPWIELDDAWRLAINDFVYSLDCAVVELHSKIKTEGKFRFIQATVSSNIDVTALHAFKIDWSQSDTSLVDDFRDWLSECRPDNAPAKVERGRQSMRDYLNALSAMRLRHRYSVTEAARITRTALGRSPYSDGFAWDRAAARAVKIFGELFPGAGEPRSFVKKLGVMGRPRKPNGP